LTYWLVCCLINDGNQLTADRVPSFPVSRLHSFQAYWGYKAWKLGGLEAGRLGGRSGDALPSFPASRLHSFPAYL